MCYNQVGYIATVYPNKGLFFRKNGVGFSADMVRGTNTIFQRLSGRRETLKKLIGSTTSLHNNDGGHLHQLNAYMGEEKIFLSYSTSPTLKMMAACTHFYGIVVQAFSRDAFRTFPRFSSGGLERHLSQSLFSLY